MSLRPYQQQALEACIQSEIGGCVIAPTGSGKSHIIAELCHHYTGKNVLVITPRRELMKQNAQKIHSDAKCMTVNKAYRDLIEADILIIDECHLVRQFDGMYQTLMQLAKKVYGFTATPFRLDCGHLIPHVFKKCLYKIDREELVKTPFLTKRKPMPIPHDHLINVRNNAFNSVKQLSKDSCPQTKRCITHFLSHVPKEKQALIFVCDIQHAQITQQYLPNSKIIHGKLPKSERDKIIKGFKSNNLQYLINCEILTTGFDYPALEHIVILRPTDSYTLHEQILGRGDRLCDGKEYNHIWDYTINSFCFESKKNKPTNFKRHCIFCLELTDYRLKNCTHCGKGLVKGEAPTKECKQCGYNNFTCATYCKECGGFVKDNVRWIKTIGAHVRFNKKGYMYIDKIKFKTNLRSYNNLISHLKNNIYYIFYYKWDNYNKSNKLLEIRIDN